MDLQEKNPQQSDQAKKYTPTAIKPYCKMLVIKTTWVQWGIQAN